MRRDKSAQKSIMRRAGEQSISQISRLSVPELPKGPKFLNKSRSPRSRQSTVVVGEMPEMPDSKAVLQEAEKSHSYRSFND